MSQTRAPQPKGRVERGGQGCLRQATLGVYNNKGGEITDADLDSKLTLMATGPDPTGLVSL